MKKYKDTKVGKSCSLHSFACITGLKIDEMHLAIEVSLCETDKYSILENIDQMIEQARKEPRAQLQTFYGTPIDAEDAELKLDDLRRWFITHFCYDAMENCDKVMELRRALAEKDGEIKRHQEDMKQKQQEWDAEKERMAEERGVMNKMDEWAKRVTYDNVVDQIASLEDASKRDDARRVFEPLLKKNQVTQLRKDVKRRVKEMNEEGGTNITIEKVEGDYVISKHVENEVNGVASGAIGMNVNKE